ncbi:unnamed protein product, partial [Closterium sp. NIES-53]
SSSSSSHNPASFPPHSTATNPTPTQTRHQFDYKAGESQVMKLHRVVSLAYNHAVAFYHSLVEFFPQFLVLADLLRANPDIPILFRRSQVDGGPWLQ